MRSSAILRIRIITSVVLLLALLILVRLYAVQVVKADEYRERGERQYVHTVVELFDRGSIFFTTRDGERVSAATIQSGYLLSINPSALSNPELVYEALNNIIEIDRDTFLTYATDVDDTYYEVSRRVSKEEAERIANLDIRGVQLHRNQWRYYPGDELQSRAIGFIAYDQNDELVGRYGLEEYYDDILLRDDEQLSVNFFAEIFSNLGSLVFDTKDEREGSVVTSIEPTVARELEKELAATQEKWGSSLTGGIIINPKTGAIYALGTYPNFNLNDRSGASIEDFRNPLVQSVYEFGSIMKPLTVAAGLDTDSITPATTYYDAGYLDVDGYTIKNFDGKGRGTVPMQEVLNQSLNTGVSFIVEEMGIDTFKQYFKELQIGSETGVDLPSETYGLVDNFFESPRKVEAMTASFGQGIALTPIAMARALSTLGNGGRLVTPHLATEIVFENGKVQPVQFPDDAQVFSAETSEEITRMLVEVVDDALASGERALPHYSVAAKTGTAQIASPDGTGYYDDRFFHSFFGYFPAYDPEFLVLLYTVEPKEVRYASETLTDPFMNLTHFLINYYNLPPDR